MTQQLLSGSPEKTHQHVDRRESPSDSAQSFQGGLQPIHQLQRMLGNRRVAQLIQAKRLTPQGKIIGLQRKLTVGAADDHYEQEADRVARQVMNTPDAVATASADRAPSLGGAQNQTQQTKSVAASITPIVQRQMGKENQEDKHREEERDEPLQAKSVGESAARPLQRQMATEEEEEEPIQTKSAGALSGPFEAGADVQTQVNLSKGGGSPLPGPVRAYMEPRFGADFSHVHVHTGSDALQMNQAVGAQAFTHGSDIYFGAGHGPTNLELTAHELTHVVQQTGGAQLRTKRLGGRSLANTNPTIQRAAAVPGASRIEQKEPEPTSAIPISTEQEPSNKSSVPLKQAADVEKASAPQAKKENAFPPAVEEAGSEDSTAEASQPKETLPPPATGEKAPATPEEDSAYQAVVAQFQVKAKNQKIPSKEPEKKQVETKLAANLTPEELDKQNAYDKHLNELEKVKQDLTVEKFMGEFKATTTKLAGTLPAHKEQHGTVQTAVELSVAKVGATQDVANQRNAHSHSLRTEAAKNVSDYQNTGKQESNFYELKVDPPGSIPTIQNAKAAAPKPKTENEISLDDKSRDLDNALLNHNVNGQTINIDEGSLALPISGESTFDEAGEAKRKAQDEIAKVKPKYRDVESAVIGESRDGIQLLVNTGLHGHHESRSTSFNQVLDAQKSHKTSIEGKKRTVFKAFEGIYEDTKSKVDKELKELNGIEETFQKILSDAEGYFNRLVRNDLEYIYTPGVFDYSDWKDKHENEIKAEFEKQKLVSRDGDFWAERNAYANALKIVRGKYSDILFENAKNIFIGEVNREVEAKIATKVVQALNAAKKHIQDGKQRVDNAFRELGPKEQEEAKNVFVAVTGRFEQLAESVEDRQREVINEMARTYNQSVGKLKATFDSIKKDVLTSWLEKAWNKLKAIVNAIIDFATRIAELLGRLVGLVGDIVSSPRYFFSNLVTGIGQGFSTFVNQIDQFLATAFFDWLRGASGLAVQMPKDWEPKGIFSLFTQLLNVSTETIWERMAIVYDRTIANAFRRGEVLLDKGLEIFAIIKNEGLGGLWDHIKESLGNILEETLGMIKETVLYAAIKKVILEIGKLLVPGGGFIAIAEKVIRLLQFIAEARDKILDLIESFVDSVEMAVKGNVPGIVKHITGALTKFITVALDFLVTLFGLGGLKEKVERFIERMRKPIIAGIDWVLNKFKPLVMKGKKLFEKGKEKVIGAGKAAVQVGLPKDPNERLRLAARASVSAARRLTGRVTQALLNPILAGITLRYGLRALQPYEKGGTWWVRATINPEIDQDLGVPSSAPASQMGPEPISAVDVREQQGLAAGQVLNVPLSLAGHRHTLFVEKPCDQIEVFMASDKERVEARYGTVASILKDYKAYLSHADDEAKKYYLKDIIESIETALSTKIPAFVNRLKGVKAKEREAILTEVKDDAKTLVEEIEKYSADLDSDLTPANVAAKLAERVYAAWEQAWRQRQAAIQNLLQPFVLRFQSLSNEVEAEARTVIPTIAAGAEVKIRGSLALGIRNAHDIKPGEEPLKFNPEDFDVDVYVQSDSLVAWAVGRGYGGDKPGEIIGGQISRVDAIVREMRETLNRSGIAGYRVVDERAFMFNVIIRNTSNAVLKQTEDIENVRKAGLPAERGQHLRIPPPEE